MNMTPDNEPTDEQLDAMLRDVQVPADLKSRLRRIPEPITAADGVGHTSSTRARWLYYALAASLLAGATFATARFLNKRTRDAAPNLAATKTNAATRTNEDAETNLEPAQENLIAGSARKSDQQDQELQILQAEVQKLKIAKLESELFQLEQLNDTRLSQSEIESIIMALAPEHSVALGGDEAYVRSEMARVQREYPNTRGAMLADKILQAIN